MTTATITPKAAARAARPRATPKPFGLKLQRGGPQAERIAAAVLEVLAGARLPSDAATALGCSLPRYYALESRALSGLIAACEPRPPGKRRSPDGELNSLRKECDKLRRESARYQALVRLARRTVGLSPPPPSAKPGSGKCRKRRPTVRALRAVALLKETPSSGEPLRDGGDDHDARTAPGGAETGGAAGRIA